MCVHLRVFESTLPRLQLFTIVLTFLVKTWFILIRYMYFFGTLFTFSVESRFDLSDASTLVNFVLVLS